MDQDATKLVQQRLAELPPDVREAVQSADLSKRVQAVGAKHHLHIDQMSELEDEVLLAMLGFSPLDALARRLSSGLRLTPQEGEALAQSVSQDIFAPVRESLKQFLARHATTSPKPAASTPSAPPAASAPLAPKPAATPAPAPTMPKPPVTQASAPKPAPTAPAAKPPAPTGPASLTPTPPPAPSAPKSDMRAADALLAKTSVSLAPDTSAKTAQTPPAAPPAPEKPAAYKTDPYREPV